MARLNAEKIAQLPDEMLSFTLASASQRLAPRLGSLAVKGRTTIQTPNYIGNTSRGVLPHISQDNQRKHINITGLYMGLEDCTPIPQLRFKPMLTSLLMLKSRSY
jgi:queuine tRNA-ribosyltransferase subunit QTRTD1